MNIVTVVMFYKLNYFYEQCQTSNQQVGQFVTSHHFNLLFIWSLLSPLLAVNKHQVAEKSNSFPETNNQQSYISNMNLLRKNLLRDKRHTAVGWYQDFNLGDPRVQAFQDPATSCRLMIQVQQSRRDLQNEPVTVLLQSCIEIYMIVSKILQLYLLGLICTTLSKYSGGRNPCSFPGQRITLLDDL